MSPPRYLDIRPLAGVVAKLDRAHLHLEKVGNLLKVFHALDPYGGIRKANVQRRQHEYKLVVRREADPSIAIEIGDFLHCVHSALLAWQLVRQHSGTPKWGTYFPIFKREADYFRTDSRPNRSCNCFPAAAHDPGCQFRSEDGGKRAFGRKSGVVKTEGMSVRAQELIQQVQPYTRGRLAPTHPLWLLHALSNRDKHVSLRLHAAVPADVELQFRIGASGSYWSPLDWRRHVWLAKAPINYGDIFARLHWRSDTEPEVHLHVTLKEAFADPGDAYGQFVLQTLSDILDFVTIEVVVNRFGPLFAR